MPKREHRLVGGRAPTPASPGAAEGGQDGGQHLRRAAVERRQQRLFLVREVLVEDALRGAGALDDLGHRRRRVALLGDDRGQRPQHPLGRVGDRLALLEGPRLCAAPARRLAAGPGAAGRRAPSRRSASASSRQLVCFVAVEALVDHLLEAADHRPHHLRRHPLAAGDLVQLADAEALEGVERPLDRRFALRPGGVDLDEAHLRGRRLGGDQAQEGFHRLPHPLLAGRRVLGLLDHRDRRLDQRLDRGQEALLLVLEVAVEGARGRRRRASTRSATVVAS